jgi:hypothetical protein
MLLVKGDNSHRYDVTRLVLGYTLAMPAVSTGKPIYRIKHRENRIPPPGYLLFKERGGG